MIKTCDHTSVGIVVFRDGKLLLINRKKFPHGLAAPAGHIDEHGVPEAPIEARAKQAAVDELYEETGLAAITLSLVAEGRKENPCRRKDGAWHYWRIYSASVSGELHPSEEETRGYLWCSKEHMKELLGGVVADMSGGPVGLEDVWRHWFNQIRVLDMFPDR